MIHKERSVSAKSLDTIRKMRILFVRHGDPDYVNDTLTEKGHREAALLAEIADDWQMGTCYVSPLGRAQHTAEYSLKKLGKTAEVKEFLREFPAQVDINHSEELQKAYPDAYKRMDGNKYQPRIVWDMLPGYMTSHPEYLDRNGWRHSEVAKYSDIENVYDRVTKEFDALLAEYGYVRENDYYRVEKECTETITFFCHYGISCVLLSHLWNISPYVLWNGIVLLPTSVTEVFSEEREQGIAYFRARRTGDLTHLYIGKEEPSFSARFREVYSGPIEQY